MSQVLLAYDGSRIDGGLYTTVTRWAADSPHWLDQLIKVWSDFGLGLFAVLMLWVWWHARRTSSVVMAQVLAAPVLVVVAYAVNSVLKSLVDEVRPCRQIVGSVSLETCPQPTDWSFPSNHSVIAFAAAVALWFVSRRIGRIALVAAVLMAVSRVWIGVHYPHDVVVGALVGTLVALPLARVAGRAAPLVDRARSGPLGALLGAGGGAGGVAA
ncbi:membrane-associated phospholipid phosphatase [Kitasatospora sp. MAP12-15]|uniref:phosphatase PAP2 family protein n=1 Tax=unclassified Kitasatospora TaxID=2633591 RepID=UPI00247570AC|nr:phosphatase PAP2 family protein [Kitasatospora sp. MAP12-44]MDH6113389.1 membrane-associated phospholipid phosphatase [Kitasatospora sp. MAP12-44]